MPKFAIEKSIYVEAPIAQVYHTVRDFKSWSVWSPWLLAEPDCVSQASADGVKNSWDGKLVGSGEMTILNEEENRIINYRLNFVKPWKSSSSVDIKFSELGSGTDVTWSMNGSLPFFMFWMTSMMKTAIGMDYERGLKMLKDLIETSSVPSKLSFQGEKVFTGVKYVGISTICKLSEVGDKMSDDFKALSSKFGDMSLKCIGAPLSFYHKFDVTHNRVSYTVAFPVDDLSTDLPDGLERGFVPTINTYQIEHTGPYRHLGNAWAAGMIHSRCKVFKQSRAQVPFEEYVSDPLSVDQNEIVTIVHFPTK